MANIVKEHRIIDSTKRALIKYVILCDGSVDSNVTMVDVSTLKFALNTSGKVMTSNTNPRSNYRSTIKRIFGQAQANSGYVKLQWGGSANNEIVTIGNGVFDYNFEVSGESAVIPNNDPAPTGDILYSTGGLASGAAVTLFIDIKKDAGDYDAGQTAAPSDFNR